MISLSGVLTGIQSEQLPAADHARATLLLRISLSIEIIHSVPLLFDHQEAETLGAVRYRSQHILLFHDLRMRER